MKLPPLLEKASWIAGVLGLVVALLAWLFPDFGKNPPEASDSVTASRITQTAGNNSTQIGQVTGSVTVNNFSSDALQEGPVDLPGKWDLQAGMIIATRTLGETDWVKFDPSFELPMKHTHIGQYNLLYKHRESVVLAFTSYDSSFPCHACSPFLSFFEFEKRVGGWKLSNQEIAVVRAGSYGMFPPEWLTIHVIGDNRYGVLLYDGWVAQGYTGGSTSIFARVGDEFRSVLSTVTEQSAPDGRAWTTNFKFNPTSTGLYDIEVNRVGRRGSNDLVFIDRKDDAKADIADSDNKVRANDVFRFDGTKYSRSQLLR